MQPDALTNIQLLPVRDQGRAETCLAFATSAAHEHLHSMDDYLSPAYLYGLAWKTDPKLNGHNGLTIGSVSKALSDKGQVLENALPYAEWLGSADFPSSHYQPKQQHYLSGLNVISTKFETVVEYINRKIPVILGLSISDAFFQVDDNGYINEPGQREMGGHAMVAISTHKNKDAEDFLLIRNSWGLTWGKDGHALISREYFHRRVIFSAILTTK